MDGEKEVMLIGIDLNDEATQKFLIELGFTKIDIECYAECASKLVFLEQRGVAMVLDELMKKLHSFGTERLPLVISALVFHLEIEKRLCALSAEERERLVPLIKEIVGVKDNGGTSVV